MMAFLELVPGIEPWTFIGLTILSFFTAAFGVVAGLGGGVMLLAVMATIVPPTILIPLHGTVLFGTNVGRAIIMRRHFLKHLLPVFFVGAVLGAFIGGKIVVTLPTATLQIILGLFILYVCWAPKIAARAYSHTKFLLLGLIGTLMGMFVGSSGTIIAPYVAAACPDRREYVATHSVFMSLIHGLKVVVFGILGFSIGAYLPLMAAMIGMAFLGSLFGRAVLNRLPEAVFRRIFQVVLTLLALRLLYSGIRNAGGL
ncbi:MAG: sulfite exporter TauE/SafE family protein [Rhodospirillaceae bacterium]|jgi:uncharacterized protein|nr:sulfite exporter TauE/SafE family protein [Rhodospirillaceae bacterium]